jgi:hypothetical protein
VVACIFSLQSLQEEAINFQKKNFTQKTANYR